MATYPALDLRFAAGPGAGTFQDMLYAELDEFEPVAIHEHEMGDGWRVFFRSATERDSARAALVSEFGNALLQLVPVDVDDEDWARRSQASLTAVRVGRIVVSPPWDTPAIRDSSLDEARDDAEALEGSQLAIRDSSQLPSAPQLDTTPNREPRAANRDIVIVIDPSTGFGTGHHATTRLCLELLQRRDLSGKRVIDVGTGSGVLAIAAWKLGAAHVIAIDNDPDALRNAQDNVARNEAGDGVEVVNLDLSSASLERADIVLANLTASVLQRHAAALQQLVVERGVFIMSGFGGEDIEDVADAFHAAPQERLAEGEWAAIAIAN